MTKTTSKKREWCLSMALIPVFIAAICIFSNKAIAQDNMKAPDGGIDNPIKDENHLITHRKGVSQELLTEYQEIVDNYLEDTSAGNPEGNVKYYWNSDSLSVEDWTRLYVIYFQMTAEQQREQLISFRMPPAAFRHLLPSGYDVSSLPPNLERPFPPSQSSYDLWKEGNNSKIWIDGKQVDNSVLKSHQITDFAHFFFSSLLRSGKQRDEYRVDLWTATGHIQFSEQLYGQPVSIEKLLEIEPEINFLVEKEKEGKKFTTLRFYGGRFNEWVTDVRDYTEGSGYNAPSESSPTTYHQKRMPPLYFSNPKPLNKWKTGKKVINSSDFELHAGQSAVYTGKVNKGSFENFGFKARVTHSEGAKAFLRIHSDANLTKGYSILIGKPSDDRRRSGSLASVRNLYKPSPASFNLEVVVQGKRIVVMIDGRKVVDYLEPDVPYRTAANITQLLSAGGLIGFHAENGTLNVANAEITPLADDLPNYPAGKEPIDERDNVLIRLQQRNFPVIDYHVHWSRSSGLEAAIERSLTDGFEFGIASNCGLGFQTTTDEQIKALFEKDFVLPTLFYGMQGEGREWPEVFSKESREMFDYVFTDALTFPDHKGRRTQLWIPNTIFMDIPEQEYMDMIMERTLKIINEEPIDFLASPTLLSAAMMADYDKYWTDARVAQFIKALKDNNIALEINAVTKVPSARIINAAKAAGIKFTLGTNNNGLRELDRLEYSLRMVEECGLTIDDMWFPKEQ